jgi:hypothetical protein
MKTGPKPIEPIIRFWQYVHIATWPGACWEWTGGLFATGYGAFSDRTSHATTAHRWLYEYLHGPLGSLCVLHRCDNRRCIRPSHLWVGTARDNSHDMVAKGRGRNQYS